MDLLIIGIALILLSIHGWRLENAGTIFRRTHPLPGQGPEPVLDTWLMRGAMVLVACAGAYMVYLSLTKN